MTKGERRGQCIRCGITTHVDHDHETGQVRGLLCSRCNTAEGCLLGSPIRAERLAAYLRKHAPKLKLVGGRHGQ